MILELVGLSLFVFIFIQIVTTALQNKIAHSFFERKSPGLPVLPNPGLFGGHINDLFITKHNCHKVDELHKKYGPTFGWYYCNKPAVSSTDLDLIKEMALEDSDNHINRIFDPHIPSLVANKIGILLAEANLWRRLRKSMAPAFTNRKILDTGVTEEIESVIAQFTESIDNKLSEATSQGENFVSLDAEDIFQRYTLSLVFKCFYKQENIIDFKSKNDFYVDIVNRGLRSFSVQIVTFCAMFPIIYPIIDWFTMNCSPFGLMESKVMDFIKHQTLLNLKAKQRAQQVESHRTFNKQNFLLEDGTRFKRNMVDYITDQFHSGKLNEFEYLRNVAILFHAANTTTSDAIKNLIYNLAAHQDVQEKLRDAILADGLESEYLQWCIDESLRLHPPVPMGCSRLLGRDVMTKSGLIPAGTFVHTPVLTIHRMKEFWGDDADEYKPERWLNAKSFHPAQYIAFGAGRRNCLGKDFALRAIKMLLDTSLRRYKFRVSSETVGETMPLFSAPGFIYIVADEPTYIAFEQLSAAQ